MANSLEEMQQHLRMATRTASAEELKRIGGVIGTEPIGAETLDDHNRRMRQTRAEPLPRVSRGRIVHTDGPWSNGHEEQCALVTHVYGDGYVPGTPVNLHVFIDMDQSIPVGHVPWYPTREAAMAALAGGELPAHSPRVCWFPARD
jgi:hypothetical protein